jgi:branched-chain amino acid transport system permease protein
VSVVVWSGITSGAVYALVAIAFTLSLVPTGVFNFAEAAIIVAGSFFAYQWFERGGLALAPALALNVVVGAMLGVACEVVAVRALRWRRVSSVETSAIVTTVGASTAIVGLMGVKWGYTPLVVPFHGPSGLVHAFGVAMAPVEIVLVVSAAVVAVVAELWFRRTRRGQACLAVAEDREAAMARGVNVSVLSLAAFGIAGGFGAAVGMFTGPITFAEPTLGTSLALGGFVALSLGGEGSFVGALCGGLLVGLVSAFATRYLGANYSDLAVLALLLATLVVRPAGFGGLAEARRV